MKRLSVSQPATQTADNSAIQSINKSDTQRGDKPTASPTLEEVRTRFETWRRAKKPRSSIPKSLWAAAVEVCKEQPIYRVCRALRLNYTELKRRVARANSVSDTQRSSKRSFVELSLGLEAHPVLCSIELESARGDKVKMSFAGKCRDLDPLELARFFWGAVQ
jgi:hypothetical protein